MTDEDTWRRVPAMTPPVEPPTWNAVASEVEPVPHEPAHAEVLPMPVSGILMITLAWASVVLFLTGPAAVLAGLGSLWARKRFLELERERPGHKGARVSSWIGKVAMAGAVAGGVMGIVILTSAVLVDIT